MTGKGREEGDDRIIVKDEVEARRGRDKREG